MLINQQSIFRSQLLPDEHLVWAGRPGTGIYFQASDIFYVFFSLFWLSFAVFWTYNAAQAGGVFALFGVPFILIGLNMLVGRFYLDAFQRKHTVYGLTEKRILICSGYFTRTYKSVDLHSLESIAYIPHQDGSGTINLGPDHSTTDKHFHWNGEWKEGPARHKLQLTRVENAREAHQRILQLQQQQLEVSH